MKTELTSDRTNAETQRTQGSAGTGVEFFEAAAQPAALGIGTPASGTTRSESRRIEPCRRPAFRILPRSLRLGVSSPLAALLLCVFALTPFAVRAATTNDLTALLQQGLFEEQANQNLPAAISNYQALARQFDQDRQLAATAVFRIGECYRMQGKTNEAATQYERVLKDFSDQTTLATLSRQNLAGMGMVEPTAAMAENSDIALWNKLKGMPKDQLEKILPTLVPDAAFTILLQRLNETEATLAQMRVNYAPENPEVLKQKALLDVLKKQISDRAAGILAGLKMRAELNQSRSLSGSANTQGNGAVTTDAEDQEIQRIQTMIQNSPDLINAPSGGPGQRFTPLGRAASKGQLRVAEFLLAKGANINSTDENHRTALDVAVEVGNRAMVEFLLSGGGDVNHKGAQGKTPLLTAIEKGFQAVTEALLANKADVNIQDNLGTTPLHSAAQGGQVKIVQMLLAAGANVNIEDHQNRTPLSYAAEKSSAEIIKPLLAAGANPNTEDIFGRTPLSYAADNGSSEIVKLLLDAKADPNDGKLDAPLLGAIRKQEAVSVELLLQAGANPNAKGQVGGIHDYSRDYSRPFDSYGVRSSLTPLFLAVSTKQLPMVQLLLKYKADPNDSQTDGRAVIFSALSDTNILEALLAAGAKVDAIDAVPAQSWNSQWTPLGKAAYNNEAGAVDMLLKHGADPNVHNPDGYTPLHFAAYQTAASNIFKSLLEAKADPNVRNVAGKTPLDVLKERLASNSLNAEQIINAKEDVQLLRQHGALDKLPDWDRIIVSRPAANFSKPVFQKGTNNWNQFTLLEAILNAYVGRQNEPLFPNLAQVTILRPHPGTTNETRIVVNLLNSTNGIDVSKDMPLEFGDVVEIPERDHALGDRPVGLTESQKTAIIDDLKGNVQLVVGDRKVELLIYPYPYSSLVGSVIQQSAAQKVLLSSSDLSRVKVIRHDPKTGKTHEWIVDCSDQQSSSSQAIPQSPSTFQTRLAEIIKRASDAQNTHPSPDLWLRNGDVIEVPEKP